MNIRHLQIAAVAAALLATAHAPPAFAIGEVTCETPETAGVVSVIPLTSVPTDDVALARVEDGERLTLAKSTVQGSGEELDECVVGPLPPLNVINGVEPTAGGPVQAYVEHGVSEQASWKGFAVEVVLPPVGAADERIDLSLLAVDFDTPAALTDQFRLIVQRAAGSAEGSLVVRQTSAQNTEVGRLPLTTGAQQVSISWPTVADPGRPFTVSVGGASVSAAVSAGSRPRAVRVGYLGVDAAGASNVPVWLRDPAFQPE